MLNKTWLRAVLATVALMLPVSAQVENRPLPTSSLKWTVDYNYGSPPSLMTMGFAADGHLRSTHSDEKLREWDVTGVRIVKSVALSPFLRLGKFAQLPIFSPDGKWGAARNFDRPNQVLIWDMQTGQQIGTLTVRAPLRDFLLQFSADGNYLAVGGETEAAANDRKYELPVTSPRGQVEVWDWKVAKLTWSKALIEPPSALSWADNGDLALASGRSRFLPQGPNNRLAGDYDEGGKVAIWNLTRDERLLQIALKLRPTAMTFSPDAKWVVVSSFFSGQKEGFGTRVFDAHTGALHATLQCRLPDRDTVSFGSPSVLAMAISGDSHFVAGPIQNGVNGIRVWNVLDGSFVGNFIMPSHQSAEVFALSPDGKTLAAGSSSARKIALFPLPAP